jgi:hypothetical protein
MWKVLNAIYYPHNKLGKGYLARTEEGVEIIKQDARRVQQAYSRIGKSKA